MLSYDVEPGLQLKLLDVPNATELFALVDKNRAYLRTWLPWIDMNTEVQDSENFILASRLTFADRTGLPLAIFLDGQIVGTIGCNTIDWANGSAEIGYWLGEAFTGRGIITKCTQALIDYCFSQGLIRIVIRAAEGNLPSRAVPERLGFTLEGIARQSSRLNGNLINLAIYSLLADDQPAITQA